MSEFEGSGSEAAASGEGQGEAQGQGQTDLGGATGTPAEMESQAKQLQATPGYIDGTLKISNPEGYKKLQEKITALFDASGQAEVPTLQAASEASVKQAEAATALIDKANQEFGALKALGFTGKLPDKIEDFHVEGWTQQRLLAEKNYGELEPLLVKSLGDIETPPQHIQALTMFLTEDDFDPELRESITELVVAFVYGRKELLAKQAKGAL